MVLSELGETNTTAAAVTARADEAAVVRTLGLIKTGHSRTGAAKGKQAWPAMAWRRLSACAGAASHARTRADMAFLVIIYIFSWNSQHTDIIK